jgi:hypothetical protein
MKVVLVAVKVSEYALVASNGPDAVTVILGQSANTEPGSPITTEVAVTIAQSRLTDFHVAVRCGWRGCCADTRVEFRAGLVRSLTAREPFGTWTIGPGDRRDTPKSPRSAIET